MSEYIYKTQGEQVQDDWLNRDTYDKILKNVENWPNWKKKAFGLCDYIDENTIEKEDKMATFYMMIGPAGCGKTTLAEKMARNEGAVLISSDAIREELFGNEEDQSDNGKVFEIAHSRIFDNLARDKSVVFDATNVVRKYRMDLLEAVDMLADLIVGVVYSGTYEECLMWNMQRNRNVPNDVIHRHFEALNRMPPTLDEGFDELIAMDLMAEMTDIMLKGGD